MKKNHPTILCLFAIALSMSSAACSANPKKSVEAETANVDVQSKAIEAPADTPLTQAAPADTPSVQAAPPTEEDAAHSDAAIKARAKKIWNNNHYSASENPFLSRSFRKLAKKVEDLDAIIAWGGVGYFEGDMLSNCPDGGVWKKCQIVSKKGNEASVKIFFDDYGRQVAVIWKMVFENGNWYVDNVINVESKFNERDGMNEYLNSNR